MLNVAVLTDNSVAAEGIDQVCAETGLLRVLFKGSPTVTNVPALMRTLLSQAPDLVLFDLGDWESVARTAGILNGGNGNLITIGFRPTWNRMEELLFKDAGFRYLIREPFSLAEIERLAYEAIHKERPIANSNLFTFLPAKAGSGCSSVAIHTAAALAKAFPKNILLIEGDRHSGVYSIMLGLDNRTGLDDALRLADVMTPLDWHQHIERVVGFHLLPSNPKHKGHLPTWLDYYQLLSQVQKKYDYLLIDLPEVVNEASAEVVRAASSIFVVCSPEITSLKMVEYRASELEACGIAKDRIRVLVNRCDRNSPPKDVLEATLKWPVFEMLPNDYARLQEAVMKESLVSPESAFGQACNGFARKLTGLPQAQPKGDAFTLLKKLARIAGV